MTDTNKRILERFFEAAHDNNEAALVALMHPDFTVHEADGMPYAGDYKGLAGWYEIFGKVTSVWKDVGIETTMLVGDASGEDFVAGITLTGKSPDGRESFKTTMLEHWIIKDGKVKECWPHYWDTHAMRMMYERSQAA